MDKSGIVTAARGALSCLLLEFAVRRSHLAKPDGTQVPQGAPLPHFPACDKLAHHQTFV